jgi:hypothetical protein
VSVHTRQIFSDIGIQRHEFLRYFGLALSDTLIHERPGHSDGEILEIEIPPLAGFEVDLSHNPSTTSCDMS